MGIQLHGSTQPGSTFIKDTSVTDRLLHTMQKLTMGFSIFISIHPLLRNANFVLNGYNNIQCVLGGIQCSCGILYLE